MQRASLILLGKHATDQIDGKTARSAGTCPELGHAAHGIEISAVVRADDPFDPLVRVVPVGVHLDSWRWDEA